MRTYSRDDYFRSRREWADYGSEWQSIRRLAAERGMLFPPSGTKHDDRDAEKPSQRAIVYRALEDNPTELRKIVSRSSSWSQVVDRIMGFEERLRANVRDDERDANFDREGWPDHRQAVMRLASILQRIEDSL